MTRKVWSYELSRDDSSEPRKLAHVGIGGVADKHAAPGEPVGGVSFSASRVKEIVHWPYRLFTRDGTSSR